MEFTSSDVDDAIEYVIREGRDGRPEVTYSDVFAAAGLPAPQVLHMQESGEVTRFMKAFHDRCIALGYPPLDSLVVNAAGPRAHFPGSGYFRVNGWADPLAENLRAEVVTSSTRHWREEQAACREFCTGRRD